MSLTAVGGKFKILSLVEEPNFPPTGITDHGLDPAPVRLNQAEQIWTITSPPTPGLQFGIGRFPYTKVDKEDRSALFPTVDASKNVAWFLTFIDEQDAYIITEDLEGTKGWTVEGANAPDAQIVINPIIVLTSDPPQYLPSQLFKVEPLD